MKSMLYASAFALAFTASAQAQPADALHVIAEGITAGGMIEPQYAFCIPADTGHVQDGTDKNPGISWSGEPAGTKSFALVMTDPDVPAPFDDAGKEGKKLAADAPRRDFYHWVVVNIPATTHSIPAGADSASLSKNGKSERQLAYGLRGINDYAGYMAGNPDRIGVYAGYDGPCPPWNDERIHHYHFKIFALDSVKLDVPENFGGTDALKAMAGHVLGSGEVVGNYTLNPALAPKAP